MVYSQQADNGLIGFCGFTLIELMIVIGIFPSIITPTIQAGVGHILALLGGAQ